MTILRRSTQGLTALLLIVVGALLVAESTDVLGDRSRREVAIGIENVAAPTSPLWATSLAGAALLVVAVMLLVAQLSPPKKGATTVLEISRNADGGTVMRGRAALGAVRHAVSGIAGVVAVDARLRSPKEVEVQLAVDDRSDVAAVERRARAILDTPFWIDLGVPDLAVDILVTHQTRAPAKPRVE